MKLAYQYFAVNSKKHLFRRGKYRPTEYDVIGYFALSSKVQIYVEHCVDDSAKLTSFRHFSIGNVYFTGNSGYRSSKIVVCRTGNIP